MNVINMIDDYTEMCSSAKKFGNFIAYKEYIGKYPNLYEGVFKYLYMTEIDNLEPMIADFDFEVVLAAARKNIENGIVESVIATAKETTEMLNYDEEYDLFIGLDLCNIGGTALPNEKGNPYVYIGIDRELNEETVKMLIPHEMNHMVRCAAIQNMQMYDFTERVVTEGLGTYCPAALYYGSSALTPEIMKKIIHLPDSIVSNLLGNRLEVEKAVAKEFGTPLTSENMREFFTWMGDDSVEYPLSGYFIGTMIISDLVAKGIDFAELTIMPSQEILAKYQHLCVRY